MRWIMGFAAMLLASPAVAQSMHECRARDGSVWYQAGQCAQPQDYVGVVRKCVAPGGAVSIQQQPCAPGHKQAYLRAAEPEQAPTASELERRRRKAERDRAESAYLSRLAGTDWIGKPQPRVYTSHVPDRRDQQRASCRSATQYRDDALARNRHRNIESLTRLNEMVSEACKGL